MIEGISVLYNKFTKYKQTLFNFNVLVIDIVYMTSSSSTIAGEKRMKQLD
ncbi:MAG: hypothetical protein ACJ704_10400 [Nitrososphaeraceae archaeon]